MSATTATLNGNVSSTTDATLDYWFEYGPTTAYGTDTAHQTISVKDRAPHSVSSSVTGLSAETAYHYRVCVHDRAANTACGVDSTVNTAPASALGPLPEPWSASPDSWPYAGRTIVAAHNVYVGSWDGYERAYDESGNLKWSTNLGQTSSFCGNQGITSAPAVDPFTGTLYLGDGTDNFDALDPRTGQILWSVPTDTSDGNYNWSSPVLYNGHAYIGTSSLCDFPLTQGKLLSINLATHQVDAVLKIVPDGQLGGGIWTNPVIDPATKTVFVTTGTQTGTSQTLTESLLALDTDTLAIKAHWQIPGDCNSNCQDLDWGTTPTLLSDSGNRKLIAAADKNGYLYAFDRSNIGAGPVWSDHIAVGGTGPQSGDGSVSNGAFDGKYLYYAGGNTTIGGRSYRGSVRAIDPATGHYVWERGLAAVPLAALAVANGEVVSPSYDAGGNAGLWVLNAATGNVDYGNAGNFYAPPAVADGFLFEGDVYGNFNAFRFPATPGQPVPLAATAPQRDATAPARRSKVIHPIHVPR